MAGNLPNGITATKGKRGTTYRVRWQGPTGQQGRTFKSRQDALDWYALVNADRVQGRRTAAPARRMTFEAWATEVFSTGRWAPNRGRERSTRDRREQQYRLHLLPRFEHVPLVAITRADVQRLVDDLESEGLKPNSVRAIFGCLSALLTDAEHDGHVPGNVARGVKLPGRAKPVGYGEDDDGEPLYLTLEQVELLADSMRIEHRALVYLGAYCGLRLGELLGLRWSDLDLDDDASAHVKVRRLVARSTDGPYVKPAPRDGKGARRDVPIPAGIVLDELRDHHDRAEVVNKGALVFPTPRGQALWQDSTFRSHVWRPAIARAEGVAVGSLPKLGTEGRRLPANLSPHKLRHTAVSVWIAAGHEPRTVSRRAGHASVAYTYDTYGGLFPETGREADAALDGLIRTARRSRSTLTSLPSAVA